MLPFSFMDKRAVSSHRVYSIEGLESRVLLSVNAWKSAVSGSWNDATKWSLGHVPLTTEDVQIVVAGNYTVTVPAPPTAQFAANSLKVGGATGTQILTINAALTINGAFTVGAGDQINITNGRLISKALVGTNSQIDGVITLNGASAKPSFLAVGGMNLIGAGQINFTTGGPDYSVNNMSGTIFSLGSGLTLHGKGGNITGQFTNKGTIKLEGGATDAWYFNTFANQGTFTSNSPGGSALQIYGLNNAAGHSITVAGGSLLLGGNTFTNAGTINATNTKLTYRMTFTSAGTVNRTNSPVYFAGFLNGQNKPFVTSDAAGAWTWTAGQLISGTYNPTAAGALKIDLTAPQGTGGALQSVTLTGDLTIPAGFTVTANGTITLATGKRILLNGTPTKHAALATFAGTLGGTGEVVFNTGGNIASNVMYGNTWTIGNGILVHGKSGTLAGGFTNNGVILADTAGETIQLSAGTNNGNIIAAPGTISVISTFKQNASGAMTAGVGGTAAGSTFGVFKFIDAMLAPALGGIFNAVLLNGFLPAVNAVFNVASFVKAPTGAFATKNLDAGNGKAFDLTQTTTSMSIKAKAVAGPFASRTAAGALTSTGTAAADTIATKQSLGVLYATMAGKTSVFFDRQIVSETVNALGGADKVNITGSRGVVINGGDANDSITGGSGNDSIDGGEGSDLLTGAGGNDSYIFTTALAAQTDTIAESANQGTDTLDFSKLTSAVTVNLASDASLATMTNRTVKTSAAGQAANIENAIGGSGADKLTGNAGNNVLTGGAGNDVIDGGAGNDVLHGGLNDDKLTGGTGADSMFGDDGNDHLAGADGGTKDLMDGGPGADTKDSADAVDTIVSIP